MDSDQNLTLSFMKTPNNYSAHDYMPILQEYKHQDRWFDKPTEVTITIAYCTIILLGLLGNGIVCVIVSRKENLRSAKNLFIMNLSISDIMMCVISMPFTLLKLTMKNWPLGKIMCKIVPFVHMTDVFVSTATIVAIAVYRHRCIVYAKKKSSSKRTIVYTLVMLWAISLALSLPVFIFSEVRPIQMMHTLVRYDICMEVWPSGKIRGLYTILLVVVQYLLPLVVISILHSRICHFLRLRITENPITRRNFERSLRAIHRHRKNMTILTSIAMTFGITWLPLTVLNIMADYDYRIFLESNFNLAYAICHLTAMLSASLNPIIYGGLNPNFREEFLSVLLCTRLRSRKGEDSIDEGVFNLPVIGMDGSTPSKSSSGTNYRSIVFNSG
ncbi:neuropeptide F receptor-like [Liolophura sinensis]|uniref:neuropeptide F receptor-like n=1 Tax=Liolophura sinensis TaxID=3198878 RepID=UPI0031582E40